MDLKGKRNPVAVTTGEFLGDIVAWDFADNDGFSAPRTRVRSIFNAHGFDCVYDVEPGDAILAAAHAGGVKKGRGIRVEPFEAPNKDTPAALGVYLVIPKGEGGDEYQCGARVRWNAAASCVGACDPEGAVGEARCLEIARSLAAKANELVVNVTNQELSHALCNAGRSLYWAPFRRRQGGVYYLVEQNAIRYRRLLDDLEKLGGFYPTIQPLFTDTDSRTTRNVQAATTYALNQELAELEALAAKAVQTGIGDRALETRREKCRALVIRANLYRQVIEAEAEEIKAKVTKIRDVFEGALKMEDDGVFAELERELAAS